MSEAADLAALFPLQASMDLGGESVPVPVLTFGMLGAMAADPDGYASFFSIFTQPVVEFIHRPEEVAALLSRLTGRPVEWFNALPAAQVARFLGALIEANEGFFVECVPALQAAGRQALEAAGG